MTDLRQELLTRLAKEMGDAGYCNYDACQEFLARAFQAGAESTSQELRRAVQELLDWVPTCSVGSSGYLRIERVKEILARMAPSSKAPSVAADREHPGNDTGGEIARTESAEAELQRLREALRLMHSVRVEFQPMDNRNKPAWEVQLDRRLHDSFLNEIDAYKEAEKLRTKLRYDWAALAASSEIPVEKE